ncbi:LysR family transcriptional regulator [Halomonas sp. M20]|uniref:LysR family transcriptional regulator n=1 Tax=Halomonas sp. M20 TaxID=2763264 RepID=UPI001D0B6AF0|nr:LysR family transcriptional regulator [Halomonas sp. M20]
MRYSAKHVQTFCTVVESGGFTGAQSLLGMSQPAISTHIRDFEIRLGFQLCHRGRGGFTLTEKGTLVYQKCRQMLNGIADFEAELGELRNLLTGTLRIGLIDNTITDPHFPVSKAINRFYQRQGDVSLKLVILPPEDLEREILNHNIHVAIGPFPNRNSRLNYQLLYREEHALYCGNRHPLFHVPDVDLDLITIGKHAISLRTYLQHSNLSSMENTQRIASVSNMEAEAILIKSGIFLGSLPIHYARRWVENSEMRAFSHPEFKYHSEFTLVTRQSPEPQYITKLFIEDLKNVVSNSSIASHDDNA